MGTWTIGQIISSILSLGGLTAAIWVIVDWTRKDERLNSLAGRVKELETRVDTMESLMQTEQATLRSLDQILRGEIMGLKESHRELLQLMHRISESVLRMEGRQEAMDKMKK